MSRRTILLVKRIFIIISFSPLLPPSRSVSLMFFALGRLAHSASAFTVHIIISDSCLLPILQLIDNSLHLLHGHVFFNIVLVSTLYVSEKLQAFQLPSSKVKVRSARHRGRHSHYTANQLIYNLFFFVFIFLLLLLHFLLSHLCTIRQTDCTRCRTV